MPTTYGSSEMHSYSDIDGVPSASDRTLLTGLLRETWGFTGTVVADYFGVAFLHLLHGVAGSWGEAAALALGAGVDVELPTVKTFGEPLLAAVAAGALEESVVDRALRRVLTQKVELGMLDPGYSPAPASADIDLDSAGNRALALELAEQSVVLLANDGTLPLGRPARIAVIGPNADDPFAVLGCYSFPSHVGTQHPDWPIGIALPTVLDAVRAEFDSSEVGYTIGTTVDGGESDFADAVALAAASDVVVLALGDRAGLFGRGTSGEGCDAESLRLPGAQQQLVDALLDVGTPVVVTLLAGRPYALGRAVTEAAAIVQSFFPGEEGATAIARVLSGAVNPSGRLPVSVPALAGTQPTTYLASPLARASDVSNIDPTAAFPFGHGLGYTTFEWTDIEIARDELTTDDTVEATLTVRNTGDRAGVEVVQVYLHDPVASVVRPVQRLVAYARVPLEPGASAEVHVAVPTDLAQFTGREGRRIVEPGALELRFARSSAVTESTAAVTLSGPVRTVDHTRALHAAVTVAPATEAARL